MSNETFGDFLRRTTDGHIGNDEDIVPADECDIIDRFARGDGVSREEEIKRLSDKLLEIHFPDGFDDGYILGDEAEIALCEGCGQEAFLVEGVVCEGCAAFFMDHGRGRNNCWKNHKCGVLTTSTGRLVKLGDILAYYSHNDEFEVIRMDGTWVKGGYARGMRKRGAYEMPIIPRLMYHKETT